MDREKRAELYRMGEGAEETIKAIIIHAGKHNPEQLLEAIKGVGGDLIKCANFMNQEAIDEVLRKQNEDWMREADFPLYQEGTNRCIQCDYGLGLEIDPQMLYMKKMAGGSIKRVCFKELESETR